MPVLIASTQGDTQQSATGTSTGLDNRSDALGRLDDHITGALIRQGEFVTRTDHLSDQQHRRRVREGGGDDFHIQRAVHLAAIVTRKQAAQTVPDEIFEE